MSNENKKYLDSVPPVYEEDWSDKWEPWAAGLGLTGDLVGLGVGATGIGVPVGATIAGIANLPSLGIDAYQAIRDGVRAYNDNGASTLSALGNVGEFALNLLGLKILASINRAKKAGVAGKKLYNAAEKTVTSSSKPYKRVGTGAGRVMAEHSAKRKKIYNVGRNVAMKESIEALAKRGVQEAQGAYFERKLIEEMARKGYGVSATDAIRSANNVHRFNLALASGLSAASNINQMR